MKVKKKYLPSFPGVENNPSREREWVREGRPEGGEDKRERKGEETGCNHRV